MPLPLPIMIPFMMWQSAAIAAGFGTYFQYAKRRVSAMSNEEFNKSNPHDLVNAMYDELIVAMPSSFKKIESLTPIILDSMLKMLTDAAEWFAGILGGTGPADALHHLQGLPGHIGHAGFGETLDTPAGDIEPINLRSLSLSEVSALSESSLLQFIQSIQEFDAKTQQFLINERQRRGQKPVVEKPSIPQQTTKLSADFVNSLSKADLKGSGKGRTRNFKGTIMKWKTTHWFTYIKKSQTLQPRVYQGNSWVDLVPSKVNIIGAIATINKFKNSSGSSFVLEFANTTFNDYFLIKDNF